MTKDTSHHPGAPEKDQEQRSILINFVLDASGSMEAIREATISGFNEFLGDQRKEGGDARMTLTLFNTTFTTYANAIPVREMADLTLDSYAPDGMTALYDAIGHTMRLTDDYYAAHNPDQVLFVVMTDGMENASREFSRRRIFEMIADRQKLAGYEFLYLGANQDSYAVGHDMGIRDGRTLDYSASPAHARQTLKRVSHNVRAYRRQSEKTVGDEVFFSPAFEQRGAIEYEEHLRRKREGRAG